MQYLKNHYQLIGLTGLIGLLWNTPVALPLKLLVVFLHELSHGAAAILTGGKIISISVSSQQGGQALTLGGNGFAILSAGYIGSLVLGVMLFFFALRSDADRFIVGVLGAVTLLIAALYIRDLFALAFCAGTGAALLASARFLGHGANDLVLRVIGLTSIAYVPLDIFSDTIARSSLRSDARMLAEEYGGTTILWGGVWLVLSLGIIVLCFRYLLGSESNLRASVSKDR